MPSSDRLAVYTTVHPGCEPFLAHWCESVRLQTDQDFDLWIGLDALTPAGMRLPGFASWPLSPATPVAISPSRVEADIGAARPVHWVVARPGDTPASLRQRAFAELVTRYDAIVLVDADDLLQRSRVAAAREALQTSDLSGCGLRLIDERGVDLGNSLAAEPDTDFPSLLTRYNVFGLSNSAYRARTLARCLPVPPDCVLTDWLLASRAAVSGATFSFDPTPRMGYRQHAANCSQVRPPFTPQGVLSAATLVARHYRLLLESDWPWPPEPVEQGRRVPFEQARARAETFHSAMRASPAALQRYTLALNRLTPRYVWWWTVANPDLEELWSPSISTAVRSARANRPS